jgi:hypothetical protein
MGMNNVSKYILVGAVLCALVVGWLVVTYGDYDDAPALMRGPEIESGQDVPDPNDANNGLTPSLKTEATGVEGSNPLGLSLESEFKKNRDATRLTDMTFLRSALDLYNDSDEIVPLRGTTGYPAVSSPTVLSGCLSELGFASSCGKIILMKVVPQNPLPGGAPYTYVSLDEKGNVCTKDPCVDFKITFSLEVGSGSKFGPGMHFATSRGIDK